MIAIALLLAATCGPAVALAQEPAPEPTAEEEARALFDEALLAIREDRHAAARDLLRRSLALNENPAAAYKLAVALRGTGELRAALASLSRLLEGELGELSPERQEQARALWSDVRRDLATLSIDACGAARIEVRVDGQRRTEIAECRGAEVELDPGPHLVILGADGAEPVERRVEVPRGGRAHVTATLTVRAPPLLPVRAPPDEDDGSILSSPWLFVGLGVVLAAVAVAAFLLVDEESPHVTDPVFGEITALRSDW